MTRLSTACVVAVAAPLLVLGVSRAFAGDEPASAPSAGGREIAALIKDLGNPSFATRTHATRRLCAIGMPAAAALRAAADGSNTETALRAQRILHVLDGLLFAGAEITLSLTPSRIDWDEAADLVITIVNTAPFPTKVPFVLDPEARQQAAPDARQVGDMLDVADWLSVRHFSGKAVQLHVDDIAADAGVLAAVERRLNGGPTSELGPGKTATITITGFNRGWARYPLLDEGEYTVILDYTPAWEDDLLASGRAGRVVSNKATMKVSRGAPEMVSRTGELADAILIRDGDELSAGITNRTDQPMLVNLNFGAVPPFAEGNWVYEHAGTYFEVPLGPKGRATWSDFKVDRVVSVAPGKSQELARISMDELRRSFAKAGADLTAEGWHVYFSYANAADRRWQSQQGAALRDDADVPAILQEPLSRHLTTIRISTNRIDGSASD